MLSIPVKDAVNILTHEICEFLSGPTGQLHSIHIAIMPNYSHSEVVSYLYTTHTMQMKFTAALSFLTLFWKYVADVSDSLWESECKNGGQCRAR